MDRHNETHTAELPGPIGIVLNGRTLDDVDRELEQAGLSTGEREQVLEHIRTTEAQRRDRTNHQEQ